MTVCMEWPLRRFHVEENFPYLLTLFAVGIEVFNADSNKANREEKGAYCNVEVRKKSSNIVQDGTLLR